MYNGIYMAYKVASVANSCARALNMLGLVQHIFNLHAIISHSLAFQDVHGVE